MNENSTFNSTEEEPFEGNKTTRGEKLEGSPQDSVALLSLLFLGVIVPIALVYFLFLKPNNKPKKKVLASFHSPKHPTEFAQLKPGCLPNNPDWIPVPCPVNFVERNGLMESITKSLSLQRSRVLLHSEGATGKTTLAIHSALKSSSNYTACGWINANSESQLRLGLILFAAKSILPRKELLCSGNEVIKKLIKELERRDDWLLIFDGVEDPKMLKNYIPEDKGHVLITSRTKLEDWNTVSSKDKPSKNRIARTSYGFKLSKSIEIPCFTTEESIKMLEAMGVKIENPKEETELFLSKKIKNLPLGIFILGRWITSEALEWNQAITQYMKYENEFESSNEIQNQDEKKSLDISTFIRFILEKVIKDEDPVSRNALQLLGNLSFLSSTGIPVSIFLQEEEFLNELETSLKDGLGDVYRYSEGFPMVDTFSEKAFDTAKRELEIFGLIHFYSEKIFVNQTIQEIVQSIIEKEMNLIEFATPLIFVTQRMFVQPIMQGQGHKSRKKKSTNPQDKNNSQDNENGKAEDDDAKELDDLFASIESLTAKIEGIESIIFQRSLGKYHLERSGNLQAAISYLQTALENLEDLSEQSPAENASQTVDIGLVLNGLAHAHTRIGQHQDSINYYERALKIWETQLGEKHPNVPTTLANLGGTYHASGNTKKALELYQRVISILQSIHGSRHPKLIDPLANIAVFHRTLRNPKECIASLQRALDIAEEEFGENSFQSASMLVHLSEVKESMGYYKEAEFHSQKALEIFRKTCDPNHPNIRIVEDSLNRIRGAQLALMNTIERQRKK